MTLAPVTITYINYTQSLIIIWLPLKHFHEKQKIIDYDINDIIINIILRRLIGSVVTSDRLLHLL